MVDVVCQFVLCILFVFFCFFFLKHNVLRAVRKQAGSGQNGPLFYCEVRCLRCT